eukprot:6490863-Amphidinium_carterae.6
MNRFAVAVVWTCLLLKALCKYNKVCGTFDVNVDKELVELAGEMTKAGKVTKSTGVLFRHFDKVHDAAQLRAAVQAELKWLRAQGLSYKDELPPLLVEQVQKALAMSLPVDAHTK